MDGARAILAIGLVRHARPGGFCPACRVLMKALDARHEPAKPMIATLLVLAVAGIAWAARVRQWRLPEWRGWPWSTNRAPWREWTEWTWVSARSSPSPRPGS